MKLLDLFSGIGGFSLGAEYNNIETIGFVEKDAFCQKVLRKHWPNTPIIGNIRDVTKDTFESVDIVCGGFPCQPFSVAGKRRGTDDDRYLWDETIRVVSLYKPRWFVGENVEGIVNIQNGMVLRQVQDDLEKEGFEVQCGIIPASGIGAWHQRKRVWIIAYSNSNRESRRSQYVQERSRELGESYVCDSQYNGSSTTKEQRGNTQTSTGSQERENSSLQSERTSRPTDNGNVSNSHSSLRRGRATISQGRGHRELGEKSREKEKRGDQSALCSSTRSAERGTDEDVSNSSSKGQLHRESGNLGEESRKTQGARENDTQGFEDTSARGKQNVSHTNSKGLQGHNSEQQLSKEELRFTTSKNDERRQSWWEIESSICTVPNGVSYELDKDRVNQIKSLGNSIVPQIAYQIFKAIVTVDKEG